jgi:hypothetical protein
MGKSRERPERYEQHSFDIGGVERPARRLYTTEDIIRLHAALKPFIELSDLRRGVAEQRDIYAALKVDRPPPAVRAIMETLSAVLRPAGREQFRSPRDIAALLMVEMGPLDQEELRTVLLDTKNRLQGMVTVYRGTLNVRAPDGRLFDLEPIVDRVESTSLCTQLSASRRARRLRVPSCRVVVSSFVRLLAAFLLDSS